MSCDNDIPSTLHDRNSNFIVDGFRDDCAELIENFLKLKSVRYSDFVKVWKEMKFHLVYSGRPTLRDMTEFGEEALDVAGKFLFSSAKDDNLQKCIAGLYLTYGLYHACPLRAKPAVRVHPLLFSVLNDLRVYAETFNHLDVLFVLCSLLRDGVFRFVATEKEYNNETTLTILSNKKSYSDTNIVTDSIRAHNFDEILGPDKGIIEEIAASIDNYNRAKCQLVGSANNIPPKELNYIDKDFPKKIMGSFKSILGNEKTNQPVSSQQKRNTRKRKLKPRNDSIIKEKSIPNEPPVEESDSGDREMAPSPSQGYKSLGIVNNEDSISGSD